jgi:hypothetical protein
MRRYFVRASATASCGAPEFLVNGLATAISQMGAPAPDSHCRVPGRPNVDPRSEPLRSETLERQGRPEREIVNLAAECTNADRLSDSLSPG